MIEGYTFVLREPRGVWERRRNRGTASRGGKTQRERENRRGSGEGELPASIKASLAQCLI